MLPIQSLCELVDHCSHLSSKRHTHTQRSSLVSCNQRKARERARGSAPPAAVSPSASSVPLPCPHCLACAPQHPGPTDAACVRPSLLHNTRHTLASAVVMTCPVLSSTATAGVERAVVATGPSGDPFSDNTDSPFLARRVAGVCTSRGSTPKQRLRVSGMLQWLVVGRPGLTKRDTLP